MFPANAAGVALIMLRSCVAIQLLLAIPSITLGLPSILKTLLVTGTALALCLGAFTPAGCVISIFLQSSTLEEHSGLTGWSLIVPLILPVVLFFLGPGAYSLDAKRYGRRIISGPNS